MASVGAKQLQARQTRTQHDTSLFCAQIRQTFATAETTLSTAWQQHVHAAMTCNACPHECLYVAEHLCNDILHAEATSSTHADNCT